MADPFTLINDDNAEHAAAFPRLPRKERMAKREKRIIAEHAAPRLTSAERWAPRQGAAPRVDRAAAPRGRGGEQI